MLDIAIYNIRHQINPFPPNVYICYRIVKIWILKIEGIMEKFPMLVAIMSL